jgi:hypothetical protein
VRTRDYVERGNRKAERGIADPGKRKCAIKMRIPIGKCASVRNEDASAIPRSALAGETAVGGAGGGRTREGKGRRGIPGIRARSVSCRASPERIPRRGPGSLITKVANEETGNAR